MSSVSEELQQIGSRFDGELRLDDLSRKIYSTDASVYQQTPTAVAIPKTENDILALIELAGRTGVGLIPRTAGTSLAGQVVGSGIVVDVSRHFNRILEINASEKWVRVQPGVIRNELNMALESHGLMFGPETATANRAMIGGMLGNNSCGANSIVYGSMREQTIEVTGFLSDGTRHTFGPVSGIQLLEFTQQTTLAGRIYSGIHQIFSDSETRNEITAQFPKPAVTRRNTGYALDQVMNAQPFCNSDQPLNLCKLIAGSEGTLFFATEIKLQLHELPPPASGLLCPHFESVDEALRAATIAMRHQPFACELIDRLVLEGAARNIEQRKNMDWVIGNPAAILVIDLRSETKEHVSSIADTIREQLVKAEFGNQFPLLFEPDLHRVWELRKAGLGVVANVIGDNKPVTVIEDTAVAIEDLPAYIAEFNALLKTKFGFDCVHYAHAGAGEIHLRPVLNLKTVEGQQQFRQIATEVAQLVKKWRGSLSGEHGDGRLRAEFLPQMIGEKNYVICKRIKQLFDPDNIFNPGKIIDAPRMDTQLRYSPGQKPDQTKTVFNFESTGGILGAAEMCSGSGDCRKTHLTGGTMCPSYMVTRDETDTTRARANVLRDVLVTGDSSFFRRGTDDAKQVLDLCLSCKACKSECPSNVDMAKLKAEFMQAHHDLHGIPIRTRFITGIDRLSRLASFAPRVHNFLTSNRFTGWLIKRTLGLHPNRSLPQLHSQTLRSWFRDHSIHANAGATGEVYLFCDELTNYYDVHIGIATVELLEALGYRVEMTQHAESGRAAISNGLLRTAKTIAQQNVNSFAPIVSPEKPLIGIEPSALLTFRDEYLDLLRGPEAQSAKQLAPNCRLIDEFVAQEFMEGRIKPDQFNDREQTIRLHGHCHQKAVASLAPTVRMLQIPRNYKVRLIPSGCCGMAGSFGFEREHFEVSNQIGELILMPAIRAEPVETLIAAAGTSCRHQILDATGRTALHPVQILLSALSSQ